MFKDPWIPKEKLFKPRCIDDRVAQEKVSFFITETGAWNYDLLNSSVDRDGVEIIRKISINLNSGDKHVWHHDKLGLYSVKSGYKLYLQNNVLFFF